MHLGQNIKYLRKLRGYTQVELSKAIGMTHSAISSYEQGNNEPTAGVLKKIAEALNVSADDLLFKDLTQTQNFLSDNESRIIAYAKDLEEGKTSPEEALSELSENDISLLNKLLKRRVVELEQAIKEENPELAKKLDID